MQGDHNNTLRQHAGHASAKMEAMRVEHAEEIAKFETQLQNLRGMLNVSTVPLA
jgi:hypothetical protein